MLEKAVVIYGCYFEGVVSLPFLAGTKTATATVFVHKPFLSSVADWGLLEVFIIKLLILKSCFF